jgi:hypothetical protein
LIEGIICRLTVVIHWYITSQVLHSLG